MKSFAIPVTSLGLLAFLNGTSTSAPLQSKVWTANWGADGSSCGAISAPCATLQRAHDNVASDGTIHILTPTDFRGTGSRGVVITKAVTINYEGEGQTRVLGSRDGPAIYVDAGPKDVVTLRGLVIDGQGVGASGIEIRNASAVRIEHCVIKNFAGLGGVGISLNSTSNSQLIVSDTIIVNNGSSGTTGGVAIRPLGSSGSANIVLQRVVLENNFIGISVDGTSSTGKGAHILIRESVISGSAIGGVIATSAISKAPTVIVLERSASVNNVGAGILADGPKTTVLLRESITTGNDTALITVNGSQLVLQRQKPRQGPYQPVREQLEARVVAVAGTVPRTALPFHTAGDLSPANDVSASAAHNVVGANDVSASDAERKLASRDSGEQTGFPEPPRPECIPEVESKSSRLMPLRELMRASSFKKRSKVHRWRRPLVRVVALRYQRHGALATGVRR